MTRRDTSWCLFTPPLYCATAVDIGLDSLDAAHELPDGRLPHEVPVALSVSSPHAVGVVA
jgi:hypothetical protein